MLTNILKIINPFFNIPGFYNKYYILFFLVNLILLIYFLIPWIKKQKLKISKTAKIALVLIIISHVVNCTVSMNPINNIADIGVQEVCQADNLFNNSRIEKFERTHGFSILIYFAKLLFSNTATYYLTGALGILGSVLIIILLFITIKTYTKKDHYAILGCLTYILIDYVVLTSSTYVTGLTYSSLIILFLFILYLTESPKNKHPRLIFYTTLFSMFFRMENAILFIPFIIYLIKNRTFVKPIDILVGYLLLIPNLVPIYNHSMVHSSIGKFGFSLNSLNLSFTTAFIQMFSSIFFVFLLIGYLKLKKTTKWILPSLIIIYSAYFVYQSFLQRHLLNLIPILIAYILIGLSFTSNLSKNRIWKILVVGLFIYSLIFIQHNLFTRYPENSHYITSQKQAGKIMGNDSIIIYTEQCLADTYSIFYNNYIIVNLPLGNMHHTMDDFLSEHSALEYDYIIFLQDWKPEKKELESVFNINLTEQEQVGVVKIYKIE